MEEHKAMIVELCPGQKNTIFTNGGGEKKCLLKKSMRRLSATLKITIIKLILRKLRISQIIG